VQRTVRERFESVELDSPGGLLESCLVLGVIIVSLKLLLISGIQDIID